MTRQLQRSIAAFASLSLILGAATACASNSAPTSSAANTPTSTVGTPKQTVEGSTTSGTPTPSGGESSAPVSAPTTPQPAVTTEDPQYIGTPAPGSTWTPPALTAEQVAANKKLRESGFKVSQVDPAVVDSYQVREPLEPFIATEDLTKDDQGAIKIISFFFDSADYLILTNNPEPLALVSSNDLLFTSALTFQVDDWFKAKAIISSQRTYVENITIASRNENEIHAKGTVHMPPILAYYRDKSMQVESPSQSGEWNFTLTWNPNGNWIVSSAEKVSSE